MCAALKLVKLLMQTNFPESRDLSCVQNIPEMIAEVGPASYTHGKAAQRPISDLAWSRLDVEPAELSEIAENREVVRSLLRLLPQRPSPEE